MARVKKCEELYDFPFFLVDALQGSTQLLGHTTHTTYGYYFTREHERFEFRCFCKNMYILFCNIICAIFIVQFIWSNGVSVVSRPFMYKFFIKHFLFACHIILTLNLNNKRIPIYKLNFFIFLMTQILVFNFSVI